MRFFSNSDCQYATVDKCKTVKITLTKYWICYVWCTVCLRSLHLLRLLRWEHSSTMLNVGLWLHRCASQNDKHVYGGVTCERRGEVLPIPSEYIIGLSIAVIIGLLVALVCLAADSYLGCRKKTSRQEDRYWEKKLIFNACFVILYLFFQNSPTIV